MSTDPTRLTREQLGFARNTCKEMAEWPPDTACEVLGSILASDAGAGAVLALHGLATPGELSSLSRSFICAAAGKLRQELELHDLVADDNDNA